MIRIIKPTMLRHSRPKLSAPGLVAQLSRRQYSPNSLAIAHQSLEQRLILLQKEWQDSHKRVKHDLSETGDHQNAQARFKELKKLKNNIYDLGERLEVIFTCFMGERAAAYEDLEELKKLFSRIRDESASRKKAIDAIRSYCDAMGKDDTGPTADQGQASVNQVLDDIRNYCDKLGKDQTDLIVSPGQTGAANASVKWVLDTIRNYCYKMGKNHTEPMANSDQAGAAEPFSFISKYRLDSVEKQFGVSLGMLDGETSAETRNDDDNGHQNTLSVRNGEIDCHQNTLPVQNGDIKYKPMILTQEMISNWRKLVDYQEQSIAYTRNMMDASATIVDQMSTWSTESPRLIESRAPNRKRCEPIHEMLIRRYKKLEEKRREVDDAMQEPLAACCAHLADYLVENGLSKPSDEDWKKSLEKLCPEIGFYMADNFVYVDETDEQGTWIHDMGYGKDEDDDDEDDGF